MAEKTTADMNSNVADFVAIPLPPEPSPIPAKTIGDNFRVSSTVLDAVAKDCDKLLRSLNTVLGDFTRVEAENRARKSGPNEVALTPLSAEIVLDSRQIETSVIDGQSAIIKLTTKTQTSNSQPDIRNSKALAAEQSIEPFSRTGP